MERLPHDYPWTTDAVAGVLDIGRFEPVEEPLAGFDVSGLRAVVAVGSNAAPEVLASKLPTARVPFVPVTMLDVAIGHSAHVSVRGFIAAAPYPCPGARTPVTISWLDADALAALDATEPNYDRVSLRSIGGSLDAGSAVRLLPEPDQIDLYVSWHGVVRSDRPWPFRSQRELFADLARTPDAAVAEAFSGDVVEVSARLAADPDLRARLIEHLHSPMT